MTQWETIELADGSATNHFILLKPGVFVNVSNAIEYYDRKTGKQTSFTDMTAGEGNIIDFMHGFMPALATGELDPYRSSGGGFATFNASVNSDKSFIDYITVDLNTLTDFVDAKGKFKKIKDLNNAECE
jgi:hypothetical protein